MIVYPHIDRGILDSWKTLIMINKIPFTFDIILYANIKLAMIEQKLYKGKVKLAISIH